MKLLLTGAFPYTDSQVKKLETLGYDLIFVQDERIPLSIDTTRLDAIVCNSLFLCNDIRSFYDLKFIQLTSAGLDRVPISYIQEHKITLHNAKDVYSVPMAEWIVLMVLTIYKKSRQFYDTQSRHLWQKQRDLLELAGKTALIVGVGSVGTEVAKRLRAFDVHLIGISRREPVQGLVDEYYTLERIGDVFGRSDIVILTIPLIDETRGLINAENIVRMKDDAVLINTSRGGIIDEGTLIQAILKGKFLGVALDVFEEEPLPQDSPLWDIEKVIVTPHNSFLSDRINTRLFDLIYKNLREFKDNSALI